MLGENWVKERIGNRGFAQLVKFGAAGASLIGINEGGKYMDSKHNIEAGDKVWNNYKEMIANTSKEPDPYSKPYQQAYKASTELYSRIPKGPLDRMEERVAADVLVKNIRGA